jgi:hypothetical protein
VNLADWWVAPCMTGLALVTLSFPFYRGLRVCLEARAATRRMEVGELRKRVESPGAPGEPLSVLMLRTLVDSLRQRGEQPREFIVDATKQYVVNEYDAHFTRPISMYANLLPPIGLAGTTAGMLALFVSLHRANASLELGALAIALLSSMCSLMGYSTLEALKLRLYGRLLDCVDDVLALQRRAEERNAATARG